MKRKTLIASTSLLFVVSLTGCGISREEARQQREEAFRAGAAAERNRCDAEIQEIKTQHAETVKRLEDEKTGLYWQGVLIGVASVALCAICGSIAHYFVVRRRTVIGKAPQDWGQKNPPPSVTAL